MNTTKSAPFTREYPHSLEAEQSVLAGVICEGTNFEDVAYLAPGDFYAPQNVELWRVLEVMYSRGDVIEPASVGMMLRDMGKLEQSGGLVYIAELAEMVVNGANASWYARIVHEHGQRRRLIDACLSASAEAYSQACDLQEIKAKLRTIADGEDAISSCGVSIGEVSARVLKNLENGTALKPMPLPWECLNSVLKGGIVPGELAVLAARPGMGKTALAGCVAVEVARSGVPVLFVSREVSEDSLTARLLARESRVDFRFFRQGIDRAANILPRIRVAHDVITGMPLTLLERSVRAVTPSEVRRVARQTKARLIIADYLQLMTPDERDKSREREVAEMSRAFKRLAMDLSVPVLLLAQLNRQVESVKREPQLSDLRESGAIEQDADIVIFLHSSQAEQGMSSSPVQVIVAKGRSSGTGRTRLKFEKPFQNFSEDMNGIAWAKPKVEDNGL